ncbi:hypothetical protein HOLleu_00541 [Holothuria leucospilota]|uniref:Uncharacterized protein n=1 Tax=Holothuria leucospilota TaxID=206669 RepID=A0A9Q1CN68_HOLLE|nr:hypothetical protein HOLleu_00541 [Holothuria leucospilota]
MSVSGSRSGKHLLFVADSRAYSFDRYTQPHVPGEGSVQVRVHYVIKRGARVADLLEPTLSKLRQWREDDFIVTRVAAGINDLTELFSLPTHTKRVLRRSAVTSSDLVREFSQFKSACLRLRPKCIVIFTTIPPASFSKFQLSKCLPQPILTAEQLQRNQADLDSTLDSVNSSIKDLNQEAQHGIVFQTLSWHTTVRKPTKRKSRSGNYTRTIRNDFSPLYDGLHAKSTTKNRWFTLLHKLFAKDLQQLTSFRPTS